MGLHQKSYNRGDTLLYPLQYTKVIVCVSVCPLFPSFPEAMVGIGRYTKWTHLRTACAPSAYPFVPLQYPELPNKKTFFQY